MDLCEVTLGSDSAVTEIVDEETSHKFKFNKSGQLEASND